MIKMGFMGRSEDDPDKLGNFSMTFPNGYTLSLAMGTTAYSKGNHETGYSVVEVAAWDENGEWVKLQEFDDVIGYQTPTQVLEIMNKVASL